MRKFTWFLCILGLLPLIVSCGKKFPEGTGNVDFSDLKRGQVSYFQNFTATCGGADDFEMTGSVIKVEVVLEHDILYLRETAEAGFGGQDGEVLAEYPIYPREDYILLPERDESHLFFFYANDTIHLRPEVDFALEQDECLLYDPSGLFIGNDIGNLPSFEMGMVSAYNKTVVSCVPGWMNLDAYLIYDEDALRISHVIMSDLAGQRVNSWVLVE